MANLRRLFPVNLTWRFGVLVLVLSIVSVGLAVQASHRTNQNTRCLADYARRSADVQQVRADASAAKDNARDALLDGVTALIRHPGHDPAAAQAKLQNLAADYRRQKAILAATRATNPLPGFPKECGDANDSTPIPLG